MYSPTPLFRLHPLRLATARRFDLSLSLLVLVFLPLLRHGGVFNDVYTLACGRFALLVLLLLAVLA